MADIYAEVTAVGIQGLSSTTTSVDGATGPQGSTGPQGASGVQGASGSAGLSGATGATGITGASGAAGDKYHTTSTSTFTIGGTGNVTVTTADLNLDYSTAQTIILAYDGSNHQHGRVVSYNQATGELVFTKTDASGGGTYSSWEINLDGAVGIAGASGVAGASGATGSQGIQGASGVDGASGVAGASGVTGASGVAGVDGATGSQGVHGASGHQGASGADGATGPQGVAGATGQTGVHGASGHQGATGLTGATGPQGASGIDGATGQTGVHGASGHQGASGIDGATGAAALWNFTGAYNIGSPYAVGDVATYDGQTWYRIDAHGGNLGDTPVEGTFWTLIAAQGASGIQGASGVDGASGIDGATGLTGATGAGPETITFTTSSTAEVVVETINASIYRSVKYEMQATSGSDYAVSELRLLIDTPNVFLTEYAGLGSPLGSFASFYSPLSNNYSSPDINNGGLSFWNNTDLTIYTTNANVIEALLSAPVSTVISLNSGALSATLASAFTEVNAGVYTATTTTSNSPNTLVTNISWTGSGDIELRFTPVNSVTTLKYKKVMIEV